MKRCRQAWGRTGFQSGAVGGCWRSRSPPCRCAARTGQTRLIGKPIHLAASPYPPSPAFATSTCDSWRRDTRIAPGCYVFNMVQRKDANVRVSAALTPVTLFACCEKRRRTVPLPQATIGASVETSHDNPFYLVKELFRLLHAISGEIDRAVIGVEILKSRSQRSCC